MRLDNIVFRLGIAPTIAAARQLIGHGHIIVNNEKVTIPSYECKTNDSISVSTKKNSRNLVKTFFETSGLKSTPIHLSFNTDTLIGKVNTLVNRQSVNLNLNELLIVEYYSRKV